MSDLEISVNFPLDSHGFLRRACPACSREFKWWSIEGDATSSLPERYFCPYCGSSASPDEWFTPEQRTHIETVVFDEVLGPSLEDLTESLQQMSRSLGGLGGFTASVEPTERRQAAPVFEPDDMKQIIFACHPNEPIKVKEPWGEAVHCLICGGFLNAT